ncbi:unnamed protein product [Heterobilharzia americana]|nr:unnamed protein product [Heterobilharzia americana]
MNCSNPSHVESNMPTTGRFEWIDDKNELIFIKFPNQKSQKFIHSRKNPHKKILMKSQSEIQMITIQDVNHFHYSQHFAQMIRSPECDKLLTTLAKYLDCYFKILKFKEKFSSEKLLPNRNQLEEQEELNIQIETLKYKFSLAYAKFLLYERNEMHTINPRPIDPVIYAKMDQNLYETFFWFFVFCMWITFRRARFKEICTQIGWFTRSEMFNSLGRQGASFFGQKEANNKNTSKIYQTHLPRASMLNKCSPALRLLLPDIEQNILKIHPNRDIKKPRETQKVIEICSVDGDERIGILGDYRHLYDDQLILNKQTIESDQIKSDDQNE